MGQAAPDWEVKQVLREARQSRLKLAEKPQLYAHLRRELDARAAEFFEELPIVANGTYKTRLFEWKGRKFVLKWTNPDNLHAERHGYDTWKYQDFFRKYRKAIKTGTITPKKYALARIRPLLTVASRENKFLVMEYLDAKSLEDSHAVLNGVSEALEEVYDDFRGAEIFQSGTMPQAMHFLVLGNTKPEKPREGRWVLAPPHDYA